REDPAAHRVPPLRVDQHARRDHQRHTDGDYSHLLSFEGPMALAARPATPADAERIAQIYNEGIEDRVGTFETRPRSTDDVRPWFDGRHPIIVVEDDGAIVAFASTSSYRARECYAGIA